jgi:hypothetical protein
VLVEPERTTESFAGHAAARNRLMHWTLQSDPAWVLAIDGDELIADGPALRQRCELTKADALALEIVEVWEATEDCLCLRTDGGWRPHDITNVWRPDRFHSPLVIEDKGHATGRVPSAVNRARRASAGTSLLHLGWAKESERAERYARYRDGDGGKYHAASHIESIMWPPERIRLAGRPWPDALLPVKDRLLARVNG